MENNGKLYLTSDENVLLDFNYRYIISNIELTHVIKKGVTNTILTNINNFCKELQIDKNIIVSILGRKIII
jgi:hypothetical protein